MSFLKKDIQTISLLTEGLPNLELTNRPKEGDIIYFPLGDRLFEIKYVEHEQPFYQLQKNYVYELRCELFRLEDEVIDTGVDDIDDEIEQLGHIQTLTLIWAGMERTLDNTSLCAVHSDNISRIWVRTILPLLRLHSHRFPLVVLQQVFASITFDYPGCFGR